MTDTTPLAPTPQSPSAAGLHQQLRDAVRSVVSVPDRVLDPILIALFAGGHVLIEGVPGTGKTLLARTLAQAVEARFNRIQFTNDLMPSDVVGSVVWRQQEDRFDFVEGPLFANLVLADEINRTSPRTLSCLLEAMENGHVSVEGERRELANPFLVLATRNPIEFHGTFPVPEAALDRFLVRVELEYPDDEAEIDLYTGQDPEEALGRTDPLMSLEALAAATRHVRQIQVGKPVAHYCHDIVRATREHPEFVLGASPRAALALLKASRARAFLDGRNYLLPDDVKALALPVLAHRVFRRDGADSRQTLTDILDRVDVRV